MIDPELSNFLLSIVSGALIAFWFTACFVWKPMVDQGNKELEEDKVEETEREIYEIKYNDEFDKISNEENEITNLTSGLGDDTPNGVIRIDYNPSTKQFEYYSDRRDIPYSILNSLAKYYCIQNNCKFIYKTMRVIDNSSPDSKPDSSDGDNNDMVFVKDVKEKREKNELNKEMNIFKYKGIENDYKSIVNKGDDSKTYITYSEYKKSL